MITGETKTGFHFQIEDETLDDYELLEALRAIDKGNQEVIPDMIELLLGYEQKEALKEHLRTSGRVSSTRMLSEVSDIFESCNAGKNL